LAHVGGELGAYRRSGVGVSEPQAQGAVGAAVCGGLITVLVGIARMFRLRRAAKTNLKALTSRR
jgi:uncharacterized integral membrane protein